MSRFPRNLAARSPLLVAGLVYGLSNAAAQAGEASPPATQPAIATLAGQCMTCHGPAGVAENPDWPTLANQNELYLRNALRAFRAGTRQSGMMQLMAQPLSDRDINELARYFSQLRTPQGLER